MTSGYRPVEARALAPRCPSRTKTSESGCSAVDSGARSSASDQTVARWPFPEIAVRGQNDPQPFGWACSSCEVTERRSRSRRSTGRVRMCQEVAACHPVPGSARKASNDTNLPCAEMSSMPAWAAERSTFPSGTLYQPPAAAWPATHQPHEAGAAEVNATVKSIATTGGTATFRHLTITPCHPKTALST